MTNGFQALLMEILFSIKNFGKNSEKIRFTPYPFSQKRYYFLYFLFILFIFIANNNYLSIKDLQIKIFFEE